MRKKTDGRDGRKVLPVKTAFLGVIVLSLAVAAGMGLPTGAEAKPQTNADGAIDQRRVIDPSSYGDIVMNRKTSAGDIAPVVFKHWTHRTKYTCNVCHTEIAFPLQANTVDIPQSGIEAGQFCGVCHNGKTAFGVSDCNQCHSYGSDTAVKKIGEALADLPKDDFGNKVNWVKALSEGKIRPATTLPDKTADKPVNEADIVMLVARFTPHPPDVVFPHKAHTQQIHCSSCHPVPFANKKGGNPNMNMLRIISGQYCGICHDRVSFPLNDCFRCHSWSAPKPVEPEKKEVKELKAEPEKKEDKGTAPLPAKPGKKKKKKKR